MEGSDMAGRAVGDFVPPLGSRLGAGEGEGASPSALTLSELWGLLKKVAALNNNDHDAKVAALHSSVIDANCKNALTHPATSSWVHPILDPGQRAHANIREATAKT
jgi:hypothetical protein